MRKIPILAAALFVILFVPRAAAAQAHCFFFNQAPPCQTTSPLAQVPKAWKSVTFGPATFVKPSKPEPLRVTGAGHAAIGHRSFGGSFHSPTEPKIAAELDCYSARPGEVSLDPNFVKAPTPMPLGHGGVVLPAAAPCTRK
jgi:hypothetical protein